MWGASAGSKISCECAIIGEKVIISLDYYCCTVSNILLIGHVLGGIGNVVIKTTGNLSCLFYH